MNIKMLMLAVTVLVSSTVVAQKKGSMFVVDCIKIINNKEKQALFFFENNWKVYRDIALQKGFIKSYNLLTTSADSTSDFNLILITEYADSIALKESENRFREIIKETRPGGPKLLDNTQPAEFRKNVFFKNALSLYASGIKE